MTDEQITSETPNELPTDLTTMTPAELDAAVSDAQAEAAELQDVDPADMTDAQVDRLEALADFTDAVAARRDQIAQETAERTARAEAAAQRLAGPDDGEPSDEDDTPEGDEPTEDVEVETEDAPEAIAAAAVRPAARMRARKNPTPKAAPVSPTAHLSLVAAADVGGGFYAGQEMADMLEVAKAFISRSKGFPQGPARQRNVRHQHNVATIERKFDQTPDGLWYGNPAYSNTQELFEAAAKESRLTGQSLVAAGGWCAPSETLYGLAAPETLDGIIDLPTVGVDRGGINYTPGPDFADIYATAGFAQTEAQAIAGTTKDCVEVDCPDFTEVRLDAVGFCVKAPLLTRSAYPEAIERWLKGTMVANQHKVAARLLTAMATSLGAALVPTLTGTPVTWSTLTALELIGEGQRQAYRLGESDTLEVVAPRWLKIAVRSDLANRNGIDERSVSDAQIAEHFADRKLAIQWVLNWQELSTPLTNVTFPATVNLMIYPAGTFVKGTADVISLDTVYDTADLQTNVYTAAFVEDGVLLAKMQHGGKLITVPVNVSGMLSAATLNDNWGTAQA